MEQASVVMEPAREKSMMEATNCYRPPRTDPSLLT